MPYYKDSQTMYAQQNQQQQRITPISQVPQENFNPPQYFADAAAAEANSIMEWFKKYWWTLLIVLIVLAVIFYMVYKGNKSGGEGIVEF